ncbi:MAG: hypothetical protein ACK4SB_15320 [Belliella pelovolcani]
MLNEFTWEQFFLALGILFTAYYLYVAVRFFGKDIASKMELKIPSKKKGQKPETSILLSESQFAKAFGELEMINADLRDNVIPAFARSKDKKVLLFQITQKLETFEGLNVPAFRHAINNCIHAEAKKIGLEITHEELENRWKDLIENMPTNKNQKT